MNGGSSRSFGVIQNNIALKRWKQARKPDTSFGVIQNNIALKLMFADSSHYVSFGVIQNNIALKQLEHDAVQLLSFGVIQNNIALKPQMQKNYHFGFVIALLILARFKFYMLPNVLLYF